MSKLKAQAWAWREGDVVYIRSKEESWVPLEEERSAAIASLTAGPWKEVSLESSLRSDGKVEVHEPGKKMKIYRSRQMAKTVFLLKGWEIKDE